MKIGILTHHYPENRNYGAMLQMYALSKTIEQFGFECYIINYDFIVPQKLNFKDFISSLAISVFATRPFRVFYNNNFPNKTQAVNSYNISELNKNIDIFLVGSDQVWRYKYVPNIKNFFFDFVDSNRLKGSYAASFGIETWSEAPESDSQEVKNLIKLFHFVSVRESSGVKICADFGVSATHVLDPVFLLHTTDYMNIASKRNYSKSIAKMLLDEPTVVGQRPTLDDEINKFSKINSLRVYDLNGYQLPFTTNIFLKLSFGKWIKIIADCDLVITDSFHCVAFCIIFSKKFICLPNYIRGFSRLKDLLVLFGLEDRICYSISDTTIKEYIEREIDYKKVELILNQQQEHSKSFLLNSLKLKV